MRVRGRRLSWRDISNAPHFVGSLHSHREELDRFPIHVMSLLDPADPGGKPLVPDLFDPVMTGFSTNAFGFRGFELLNGHDGPAIIQEWYCSQA